MSPPESSPPESPPGSSQPGSSPPGSPPGSSPSGSDALVEQVAAVVTAHPAVAALHPGPFGVVASYLPGRRLVGVRAGSAGEPVEIGVVLRLGAPIPDVVRALRAAVAPLCGGVPVDIAVMDVVWDHEADVEPAAPSELGPIRT